MERQITEYYQDGRIKMRTELTGITTWWYQNGCVEHRVQYNEQGEIEGLCEWFWANGNKQSRAMYRGGKIIGAVEMWNEDGTPL